MQNYKKKNAEELWKWFEKTALKIKQIKASSQWQKALDAKPNDMTMMPVVHMLERQK